MTLRLSCLFAGVMFISLSCNNPEKQIDNNAPADTGKPVIAKQAQALTNDELPLLYMKRVDFITSVVNNRKLVFKMVITPQNSLGLAGWSSSNNGNASIDFNSTPNVNLTAGSPSGFSIAPGYYLGDIVLDQQKVSALRTYLGTVSQTWLELKPQKDTTFDNHIMYRFVLNTVEPAINANKETFAELPTNYYANPSPPRGF